MINKNITTIRLKNSFEVVTGYTFRYSIQETHNGNLFLLQAKDVINNFFIKESILSRISFDTYSTEAFVRYDDIILCSRGNIQASVIKSNEEDIIASSSVFILRSKDNCVLSEYLAIYFNSNQGQADLSRVLVGSSIKSIKKVDLENMEIPVPSLEVQENIVSLHNKGLELNKLISRKAELNLNIMNGIINKFSK